MNYRAAIAYNKLLKSGRPLQTTCTIRNIHRSRGVGVFLQEPNIWYFLFQSSSSITASIIDNDVGT